jgi:hypothetical protein
MRTGLALLCALFDHFEMSIGDLRAACFLENPGFCQKRAADPKDGGRTRCYNPSHACSNRWGACYQASPAVGRVVLNKSQTVEDGDL